MNTYYIDRFACSFCADGSKGKPFTDRDQLRNPTDRSRLLFRRGQEWPDRVTNIPPGSVWGAWGDSELLPVLAGGVELENTADLMFLDLSFSSLDPDTSAVNIRPDVKDAIFDDCLMSGATSHGVLDRGTNSKFCDCSFLSNGNNGLWADGSENILITRCDFMGNGYGPARKRDKGGVGFWNTKGVIEDSIIEHGGEEVDGYITGRGRTVEIGAGEGHSMTAVLRGCRIIDRRTHDDKPVLLAYNGHLTMSDCTLIVKNGAKAVAMFSDWKGRKALFDIWNNDFIGPAEIGAKFYQGADKPREECGPGHPDSAGRFVGNTCIDTGRPVSTDRPHWNIHRVEGLETTRFFKTCGQEQPDDR